MLTTVVVLGSADVATRVVVLVGHTHVDETVVVVGGPVVVVSATSIDMHVVELELYSYPAAHKLQSLPA